MCLRPVYLRLQGISVPCGKCFECRVSKAREWSYRIVLESRLYKENCMVTLTYNDEHLPKDMSVNRRDLQLFLKRLRKSIFPKKIRVFYCGEYGAKRLRPHYHVIIFGYSFADRYFFKNDKKGTPLYRSPSLEKLWSVVDGYDEYGKEKRSSIGFSSVIDVSQEVAKYVSLYLQKPPIDGRHRPFVGMSNRPGIAYAAIRDSLIVSDKLYLDGHYIKLPRYFLNVLERDGFDLTALKDRRKTNAALARFDFLSDPALWYRERNNKIKKIEKVFGRRLDKNLMV